MYEREETSERPVIHVGCDIGQVVDKSTIAVARLTPKDVGNTRTVWQWAKTRTMTGLRRISRQVEVPDLATLYEFLLFASVPLGTRYKDVAHKVLNVGCDKRFAGCDVHIFVEMEDELPRRGCPHPVTLHGITFTGGDNYDQERGSLSKEYLASRLTLLFEQGWSSFRRGPAKAQNS